jgi:hypothetical protein
MATTKTLTPTNQAITLAAFTEKPDNRTNVTNDDKLADAVNALNSKLTLENANVSSNTTVIKGGTAGAVVPSLSASYAKYGNLVHFSYLFWGGSIDGANSQQIILNLPLPASQRTIRYYGHVGFSNAGIPDLYTVISANNATGAGQIAFVHHTSTGAEEVVTGEQISGKTVQGDIWYFTE